MLYRGHRETADLYFLGAALGAPLTAVFCNPTLLLHIAEGNIEYLHKLYPMPEEEVPAHQEKKTTKNLYSCFLLQSKQGFKILFYHFFFLPLN